MNYSKKIGRFSVAQLKRPIGEGGLGVLDPVIQHQALQLRWVKPLLNQTPDQIIDSLDMAVFWLRHVISSTMNPASTLDAGQSSSTSSPLVLHSNFVLFSNQLRSQVPSKLNLFSPIRSIISCINTLPDPHNHPEFQLPIAVVLELPINNIWSTSSD
ncbi:uncharacterized protein EV154DRAFT_328962 [Mucor mucedo]|uniref:uncharacterized protein n=1 Tax=Mucor mucedo TaxID=29922 RepID=UPI00221FEE0E|nr:uncharacterized protein EV154DRAFT_328962 [Mucor mucedo]KAI7887794.1 hypothetical protein EV154DRAFT_328962 [Mucor mucedo]